MKIKMNARRGGRRKQRKGRGGEGRGRALGLKYKKPWRYGNENSISILHVRIYITPGDSRRSPLHRHAEYITPLQQYTHTTIQ